MLLAGDIGGTKTSLAVFASGDQLHDPLLQQKFPSGQYPSLEAIVLEFLKPLQWPIHSACFGVAGPVVGGRAEITNLPWQLDEGTLQEQLHIPSVRLVNDLAAIAHAIPTLTAGDLHTVNAGKPRPDGSIAVIAPGTGLGEAFLSRNGDQWMVHGSEGGHADFAPTTSRQIDLLRHLHERLGHVSCERVCSGLGIPNIYSFLKDTGFAPEPAWLAEQLRSAEDQTPIIVNAAQNGSEANPLCVETVSMFVSILGSEAGNLALRVLATGGVFIAGGIAPRILDWLHDGNLMRPFLDKGRMSDLLVDVPVQVVTNRNVALLGAAAFGFQPR